MIPTTKPSDLLDFFHSEMLKFSTYMSRVDAISDNNGTYSLEQFCSMYSDIPVSLITPTTYLLKPNTFEKSNADMLQLVTNKVSELHSLSPVEPELVQLMLEILSIEYTHASCHIEGNPLRRSETELVITQMLSIAKHAGQKRVVIPKEGTRTKNKPLIKLLDRNNKPVDVASDSQLKELSEQPYTSQDFDEVKNHKNTIDAFLINAIRCDKFDIQLPQSIHKSLMQNIELENLPGEYRTVEVHVANSAFQNPKLDEVSGLMAHFMTNLNLRLSERDTHPVELAAWAHDMLVRIHPFRDGNGRTARILMNVILIHFGYPICFWPEELEGVYWSACETAHVDNDLSHIYRIVSEAVNHFLDIYLAVYKGEHLDLFHNPHSPHNYYSFKGVKAMTISIEK